MNVLFDGGNLEGFTAQWDVLVEGWMNAKYGLCDDMQVMQYERGDMMFMDPDALAVLVEEFWKIIRDSGTVQSVHVFEHFWANNGIFLLVSNHEVLLRDIYQYLWVEVCGMSTEKVVEVDHLKERLEHVVIDMYLAGAQQGALQPWWRSALSRRIIFWGEGQREGDARLTRDFWNGVDCVASLGVEYLPKDVKQQIRMHMYSLSTMAGQRLGEFWDVVVQGLVLRSIYRNNEKERALDHVRESVWEAVSRVRP